MIRRGFILLALGCSLGLLFATWLQPRPVQGGDAPPELLVEPKAPSAATREFSRPFVEATRKVLPTVVQVLNYGTDRAGRLFQQGSGSGFIFSKDGHILTNRHVIRRASRIAVKMHDGKVLARIKVIGADPRSDIAVLLVEGEKNLPYAELGDSDRVEVGEWAIAIGAPFELASSVSTGVVSGVGRTGVLGSRRDTVEYSEAFIQTDAALNPGNSGGPLINLDAQVIGINTAIETGRQGRANLGIGFAIPINLARTISIALIERGVAKRGWMGVSVKRMLGHELKSQRNLDLPGALRVEHVSEGSPAQKAGLKKDDVIVRVDGRAMNNLKVLGARLSQAGPGGTVSVEYYRDREPLKTKIRLAEEPLYTFGLEVETLDSATAREMGLRASAQGAVVTKVEAKSPAAEYAGARIYPGDVIFQVDTRFGRYAIRSAKDYEQVMLLQPAVIKISVATKEGTREYFLKRY
ncbi:MAG: trypsin-like peptidase domain-containing protein [Planctomycetota bacterium]|jgi:serine protease Do